MFEFNAIFLSIKRVHLETYPDLKSLLFGLINALGAALLAAGSAKEAEQLFRDDLQRNPRNPRSLFGLLESLKAQQRSADAAWVERQFKEAWKFADTKLDVKDL